MNSTSIVRQYAILKNDWGAFNAKSSKKLYTPEFKVVVVVTMCKECMACRDVAYRFEVNDRHVRSWECMYLTKVLHNRRAKAKLKGLPPAIYRQQALSAA